jgi:hypothetical protein
MLDLLLDIGIVNLETELVQFTLNVSEDAFLKLLSFRKDFLHSHGT